MRTVMTAPATSADELNGSGGRLVTADGRTLPLRGAEVRADARGGVARVVLEQRFENVYDDPLHVTYLMPLPADGAVSGYAFTIGARRVVGEVDKKRRARERFNEAILAGKTAGLVDQERSSLFTQELGNVPPRSTVVAQITIDQRLTWLDEGAWEWRFPTVAGPRYQGAPGRVADAARTEVAVADAPLPIAIRLGLTIRDAITEGRRPESPMHSIHAVTHAGACDVGFAAETGVRLDRDIVIRWPVAAPRVGLSVDVGRAAHGATQSRAFGLISMVPPQAGSAAARPRRRDLSLLLDTSGSMGGEPLAQCKKTCLALIETLEEHDTLEMIEFSSAARRWKGKPVAASESNKKDAKKWLGKLEAGGGTEMVAGVMAALEPLSNEAQRQVVLLTDGYIGFENEVVRTVSDKLPKGSRLHVVGVGSAVNRSLTGPASRAGRGVEMIVAPGEDVERPVMRLLARTASPIVTDLELSGDALLEVAPRRLPDLFSGSPAVAAVALKPEGGTLIVRGRVADGAWEERVQVRACAPGEGSIAAAALFGRETVEDLELELAGGGDASAIDERIESIGLAFQISTRLTSWIAVSQEVMIDPGAPTRREEVPQELPHGVSAEGLGLRGAADRSTVTGAFAAIAPPAPSPVHASMPGQGMGAGAPRMIAPQGAGGPMAPAKRSSGLLGGLGRAISSLVGGRDDDAKDAGADLDEELALEPPAEAAELKKADEAKAGMSRGEAQDRRHKSVDKPRPAPPAEPLKVAAPTGKQPAKKKEAIAAKRRAKAILRMRRGRQLVLEITVGADGIEWSPPADATVALDDGSATAGRIDAAKTTRAGRYGAGTVIRLVIDLDDDVEDVTPTLITLADLELEVLSA